MLAVMRASASGLRAQQLAVDVIANNLANVNTNGFRRSRVELADLPPRRLQEEAQEAGLPALATREAGSGVEVLAVPKLYDAGALQTTGVPTDLAIEGEGFFMVQLPDGTTAYTRDGSFKVDEAGHLVTANGLRLQPDVTVAAGLREVQVGPDGGVFALNAQGEQVQVGEIQLARFVNPAGLFSIGQNLFVATQASGPAQAGIPGENGFGKLLSGSLESSNVDVTEEITSMLMAQRAYAMNAKALQTTDEMLALANQLRGA